MQSKLVLLACEHVFSAVPALVDSLLGIHVSESQVYRTTQRAAFVADESVVDEPSASLAEQLSCPGQIVYGMVDGSMLLTEQGWQETKVGRVFEAHLAQPAHLALSDERQADERQAELNWQMGPSEYVALRGHYEEFSQKFEQLYPPDSACRQVFVSDGALWIGKWLKDKYPSATHILDYYHLKQKLALAAQTTANGQDWLAQQEKSLFEGIHPLKQP